MIFNIYRQIDDDKFLRKYWESESLNLLVFGKKMRIIPRYNIHLSFENMI